MNDPIPAYVKNGKTIYFPAIESIEDMAINYEANKEQREKARIKGIQDIFDDFCDSDEERMGLIELVELCGGELPSETDICTACGSDEARYTSHYNNNAECQS